VFDDLKKIFTKIIKTLKLIPNHPDIPSETPQKKKKKDRLHCGAGLTINY